ncbi:MAG: DUF2019 domain-containing protein [Hyphomicrobium sp.]|nr:DUF2019 domain-containing protein [Hyphomicrobium sp.]
MKRSAIQGLDIEQLVARFEAIGLEQDRAIHTDENAIYNRLYREMELVEQELKGRDGDQRSALLPLLQHKNPQVRLTAAIVLLALEPKVARTALQKMWDTQEFPQAGDAMGMMRALDEGRYVPT